MESHEQEERKRGTDDLSNVTLKLIRVYPPASAADRFRAGLRLLC